MPAMRRLTTGCSGRRAAAECRGVFFEAGMTTAPEAPRATAMQSGGAYNRSSAVPAGGLAPAVPWLTEAAKLVPLGSPETPLIVADYGSSQGRNSMAPLSAAISALRERSGADRPIAVVHTDLPGNDFSALFQTIA